MVCSHVSVSFTNSVFSSSTVEIHTGIIYNEESLHFCGRKKYFLSAMQSEIDFDYEKRLFNWSTQKSKLLK